MESLGYLTAAEEEHFEERAAIVEHLAGWPRPMAEAEARRALGERRWRLTVNVTPEFLNGPKESHPAAPVFAFADKGLFCDALRSSVQSLCKAFLAEGSQVNLT